MPPNAPKHSVDQSISPWNIQSIYINLQRIFRCINIGRSFKGNRLPISITQMRVLSVFNEYERVTVSEISRALNMSLQSTTNIVHRLEMQGYLIRSKNKRDRRVSEVKLTQKGRNRLNAFKNGEITTLQSLLQRLNVFEKKIIAESLNNASTLFEKAIRLTAEKKDT